MINNKNKTLSAVITSDSVLSVIIDDDSVIYDSTTYPVDEFISKKHAGDFIDYQIKILSATDKFVISDNSNYEDHEDFSVGCQKFTGQNIFVKFIQHFKELNTSVHVCALLDHYYYLSEKEVIHLHFEKNAMHLYIKQNGLFILYNVYNVENEIDVLYFCNLAFDSLNEQLKPENLWVLSGWIDKDSIYEKTLLKYFPSFTYIKTPISFVGGPSKLNNHYFFLHYLNQLCES